MQVFSTINSKDYTVDEMYISSPISWELISGSTGVVVTSPDSFDGAVTIEVASNTPDDFFQYEYKPKINQYTDTYEYLLYRSVKHLFYDHNNFYSSSILTSASISGLSDHIYVISIGQNFYGDRVKPGSFELSTEIANKYIYDDAFGNLYVNHSGSNHYIGNLFYTNGIAVIRHDTSSLSTAIGPNGMKIVQNTEVYVDYSSDVKFHRHQVNVNISPAQFNFSPFNPSILATFEATSSATQSLLDKNIKPASGSSAWNLYNLMGAEVIKPYITTIGLYNDQYELLAVAKINQPIQRTFEVDQIFIIRFDV
jgi:hypothetical protein